MVFTVSFAAAVVAFAVDLGIQRSNRRTMQARADIIALDLARLADGRIADTPKLLLGGQCDLGHAVGGLAGQGGGAVITVGTGTADQVNGASGFPVGVVIAIVVVVAGVFVIRTVINAQRAAAGEQHHVLPPGLAQDPPVGRDGVDDVVHVWALPLGQRRFQALSQVGVGGGVSSAGLALGELSAPQREAAMAGRKAKSKELTKAPVKATARVKTGRICDGGISGSLSWRLTTAITLPAPNGVRPVSAGATVSTNVGVTEYGTPDVLRVRGRVSAASVSGGP